MIQRYLALAILSTAIAACRAPSSTQSPEGAAVMVEPGVISTAAPEFAFTVTPDGSEIYFNRASPDRATLSIMVSSRRGASWSTPTIASFSGTFRDVDPFVTPDGRRLYFSSNRPRENAKDRFFHTWYVERIASGWSGATDAGLQLNSDSIDAFVSVSREGTLVFGSNRDGSSQLYASSPTATGWTSPRAIPVGLGAGNPAISPSGKFVVFVREVPGARSNLFFSCWSGTDWGPGEPLGSAVNSPFADFAPYVDAAERALYFTSERPGIVGAVADSVRPPGDLYRIALSAAGVRCR